MSLMHSARRLFQRAGLDVQRYPESDPTHRLVKLLSSQRVDLVLDVGANNGGYATSLRRHGFTGRIMSFEPLADLFAELHTRSIRDDRWDAIQCAIGAERATVTINIAGNAGASSSVLPMLDRHHEVAPSSAYVGTEVVEMFSIDEAVPMLGGAAGDRMLLKADVQGYERAVLDGAAELLRSGRIIGIQLELSFVPLYAGGMTWREGLDRAADLGLTLMALVPGFTDPNTGQMLQADGIFFR